ncbi:hypothetical protein QAD02_015358 [Eretmocerus hayati]|uniref:Uncharacterized protein n=1 Tax=Eretmocerus hayati TaxID=131215 RepID=A0ACC2P9P1_9HYME|nr:hypothetical protein QAD02_015358 [Eretmocerus hayati]
MPYYVVLRGRNPGIYHDLEEYLDEVDGYPSNYSRRFDDWSEARAFMKYHRVLGGPAQSSLVGATGGYQHDSNGRVIIHAVGVILNQNTDEAEAAIGVWFGPNHPRNISQLVEGNPTLNDAEIQAATAAIREASDANIGSIVLKTYSRYMAETVRVYLETWKALGWIRTGGDPLANEESLKELDDALSLYDDSDVLWVNCGSLQSHARRYL